VVVGDAAAGQSASGGGNDRELGDIGNDLLIGDNLGLGKGARVNGGGADNLKGGNDNDSFVAGPARDRCSGGDGRDKDRSKPPCENRSSIP
jgi:hypothetical protein